MSDLKKASGNLHDFRIDDGRMTLPRLRSYQG